MTTQVIQARWGSSGFNAAHCFDNCAPCWDGAETQAHITAFFQRNMCRLIEDVAAKHGIDLQAEMRKSEAVERTLAELRKRA